MNQEKRGSNQKVKASSNVGVFLGFLGRFASGANIQLQPVNRGVPDVGAGVGTVQVGWSQTGHLRGGRRRRRRKEMGGVSLFSFSTGPLILSSLAL